MKRFAALLSVAALTGCGFVELGGPSYSVDGDDSSTGDAADISTIEGTWNESTSRLDDYKVFNFTVTASGTVYNSTNYGNDLDSAGLECRYMMSGKYTSFTKATTADVTNSGKTSDSEKPTHVLAWSVTSYSLVVDTHNDSGCQAWIDAKNEAVSSTTLKGKRYFRFPATGELVEVTSDTRFKRE